MNLYLKISVCEFQLIQNHFNYALRSQKPVITVAQFC